MRRSLLTKLTVGLVVLLLLAGAGFLGLTVRTSQMYEQEVQQRLNAELAPHIAGAYELLDGTAVNEESLETLFTELMHVNPAIEVYLLDASGEILAFSAPEGHVQRRRVSLAPIQQLLEGEGEGPVLGDDPRSQRRKVFSAAALVRDGVQLGYVYVVLAGEAYDGVAGMLARSYMLRLAAWISAGILAITLVVGTTFFYRLTRPLVELDREMREFAAALAGTPAGPGPVNGDEVSSLQVSFRGMAERIRTQMEALNRADRSRRELVANVSHDLRTPLAHLTGYIETLRLQGDRLTAAERDEHLGVAIRHGERLSQLIDELFELARLDTLDAPATAERFGLEELVRDVARRYRPVAERRGVEFGTDLAIADCEVVGDPRLIERSLANLLDNALHHTPDGGSVDLSAKREDDGVSLSVRDSGDGIPPEHQPHVFERFYRGTSDTGQGGGGLGLAIAKRAIELHRGSIGFSCVPGRGTTFRVQLPIV